MGGPDDDVAARSGVVADEGGDGGEAIGVGAEGGGARVVAVAPGVAQDAVKDVEGEGGFLFCGESSELCGGEFFDFGNFREVAGENFRGQDFALEGGEIEAATVERGGSGDACASDDAGTVEGEVEVARIADAGDACAGAVRAGGAGAKVEVEVEVEVAPGKDFESAGSGDLDVIRLRIRDGVSGNAGASDVVASGGGGGAKERACVVGDEVASGTDDADAEGLQVGRCR